MDKKDNLIPQSHVLTVDEQSRGGQKSGKVRREKASLRKALKILLEEKWLDETTGKVLSGAELISLRLFEKAMTGDVKAFEIVRNTIGEMPVEKIQISEISQDVIDEVEAMVLEEKKEIKNDN